MHAQYVRKAERQAHAPPAHLPSFPASGSAASVDVSKSTFPE
jgi:hypothetical protein